MNRVKMDIDSFWTNLPNCMEYNHTTLLKLYFFRAIQKKYMYILFLVVCQNKKD